MSTEEKLERTLSVRVQATPQNEGSIIKFYVELKHTLFLFG